MSDTRKTPSELASVISNPAGQVLATETEEVLPLDERLGLEYRGATYSGSQVLDIPPRRWLSKGWLPLDSVGALYAPPGAGKSFYALSLSLEAARGGSWPYALSETLPVLYVAAERATDLRDRAEAWQSHHEKPLPDSWHLLAPRHAPQLTNPVHVEALCGLIREKGARFVVLDTYARMTLGLEENSSKDTGPVLEALSEIREATAGGVVLVVHHTGKDTSKGLRGSSAFLGAVDFTLEVTQPQPGTLKARVTKSNAGPEPSPEWYRLEPVSLPPLSGEVESREVPVLVGSGTPPPNPELAGQVLELFESHFPNRAASPVEIHEALEETYGQKISRATLNRTLAPLYEGSGPLVIEGKGRATRYRLAGD